MTWLLSILYLLIIVFRPLILNMTTIIIDVVTINFAVFYLCHLYSLPFSLFFCLLLDWPLLRVLFYTLWWLMNFLLHVFIGYFSSYYTSLIYHSLPSTLIGIIALMYSIRTLKSILYSLFAIFVIFYFYMLKTL